MEKLSLTISGMSCAHCVAHVKQALAALPGVHADDVGIGVATISYDASMESADAIASAVSAAGYPARVASGAR
jgi:copper chaperone CopZ